MPQFFGSIGVTLGCTVDPSRITTTSARSDEAEILAPIFTAPDGTSPSGGGTSPLRIGLRPATAGLGEGDGARTSMAGAATGDEPGTASVGGGSASPRSD